MECDNCGNVIEDGVYVNTGYTLNACSFECICDMFLDVRQITVRNREIE